jgi:hypothetical protein
MAYPRRKLFQVSCGTSTVKVPGMEYEKECCCKPRFHLIDVSKLVGV